MPRTKGARDKKPRKRRSKKTTPTTPAKMTPHWEELFKISAEAANRRTAAFVRAETERKAREKKKPEQVLITRFL
jgi:hypothetical protein